LRRDEDQRHGRRPRHPFAFRDFRFFWTARLCSTLAQNTLVIVVGWQVYDLARATMDTKDAALQLGFVGLAQFAAAVRADPGHRLGGRPLRPPADHLPDHEPATAAAPPPWAC
jgi:hypothetical protein